MLRFIVSLLNKDDDYIVKVYLKKSLSQKLIREIQYGWKSVGSKFL